MRCRDGGLPGVVVEAVEAEVVTVLLPGWLWKEAYRKPLIRQDV